MCDAGGRLVRPPSAAEALRQGGDVGRDLVAVDWARTALGPPEGWPPTLVAALRLVLGSRFSMWMAWGPELTFFCNDAYRRDTLGLKYPWALGRPAREVWAEIWDDIGPRIDQVVTTAEATWDEALLLFLERSGYREETYHTFSYSPIADDAGATAGMLCVVAEETERVVGERRLATLNALAGALSTATGTDDVVAIAGRELDRNTLDLPFTLTYLVDDEGREARLVGATGPVTASALPAHIDLLLPSPLLPPEVRRAGASAVRTAAGVLPRGMTVRGAWETPVEHVVLVPLPAPGSESRLVGWMAVGMSPHRPADAAYVGFIELVAGQLAAALASARAYDAERLRAERLAELDRAKTMFFTNISHELRTPLTLMLGPLDDAVDDASAPLPPAQRERVELARRNGRRLLALVNTLLDFNRAQDGRLEPVIEQVDLAAETAELAGMFRSALEAGGVELVVDCPPLGHAVRCDRRMWEQVVTNLVSNAFKHTFAGTVRVSLRETAEGVELEVADTGEGIPAAERELVFDRFHRVHGARARSAEGSGIGLALVRELVAVLGGRVELASEVGVGTTVNVALPSRLLAPLPAAAPTPATVHAASSARVAEAEGWVALGATGDGAGAARDGGRPRILVVDDNADMRVYLDRLLREEFVVEHAATGGEALALLRADPPDLLLSDVMMPELDGFELVRTVRGDAALHDLPVILLSARAGPESAVAGLDLGADDYIAKPFNASDLRGRVRARLASGRERRQRAELSELAARIGSASGVDDVAADVAEWASRTLGAANATLALVDDDGVSARFVHGARYGRGVDERYAVAPLDAPVPSCMAIRDGTTFVLEDLAAIAAVSPTAAAECRLLGLEAELALPLVTAAGRTIGTVALVWSEPRALPPGDVALVGRVAGIVADAVRRIRVAEREHHLLQQFQERLLEVDVGSTCAALAVRYRPAEEAILVGGDWYDIVSRDTGGVGISVGDVVGKGLAAATAMGQLRSAVATAATAVDDPAAVVALVDAYARRLPEALGTTLVYLTLDPDGALRFCRAGHPPPLVAGPSGTRFLEGGSRGPLSAPASGEAVAGSLVLEPCGLLLVYTDGLVERRREPLDAGLERLAGTVRRHLHLPVGALCDAVVRDMRPESGAFNDDVALVAARRVGASATHLVDVYRATPGELSAARARLRGWLATVGVGERDAHDLLLAVGEASANAIEHGGRGGTRAVTVEASLHAGVLLASVSDSGRAWDDSTRGVERGRGRGFSIMRACTSETSVRRDRLGTSVLLRLALAGDRGS